MRRRDYLRRAAGVAVAVVAGTTVAREAFARGEATASQVVVRGVPQPLTDLVVRVGRPVDVLDVDGIGATVEALDPTTSEVWSRSVAVVEADASGSTLSLRVAGPVTQGTVLRFEPGSIAIDGQTAGALALRVDGVDLLSPARAVRWFKAYEPTDVSLFDPDVYGGTVAPVSNANGGRRNTAAVRRRLAEHLDRFVARGWLTSDERAAALDRFDDPVVRGRFADEAGRFDPVLLAGVLANAGTVARDVIGVLVDGENRLGQPYLVRRQSTPSGGFMEVRIYNGSPVIYVDSQVGEEPFTVLAPLFAHEGLHQDVSVGLEEEIVSTYLETLVYAQHVLADPAVASGSTPKGRRANTMLLVALNSGTLGFPNLGLGTAPHRQQVTNATPRSTRSLASFVSAVERNYRRTEPGDSPGTPYLEAFVAAVTGTSAVGVRFDDALLDRLDAGTTLFSTGELLELLATLRLTLASDDPTTPLVDAVATADASLDAPGEEVDGFDEDTDDSDSAGERQRGKPTSIARRPLDGLETHAGLDESAVLDGLGTHASLDESAVLDGSEPFEAVPHHLLGCGTCLSLSDRD